MYGYDPIGRRVTRQSDGGQPTVEVFGLDPNAVAELSGGVQTARNTFDLGYDRPLARTTSGGGSVFFGQDALSSVTSLFNGAGQVTGRASYTTYGQLASQTGAVSPWTYTGREWDFGRADDAVDLLAAGVSAAVPVASNPDDLDEDCGGRAR